MTKKRDPDGASPLVREMAEGMDSVIAALKAGGSIEKLARPAPNLDPEPMRRDQRIVTKLPLTELWGADGPVAAARVRDLSDSDVRELLRTGPARFAVADVGGPLEWVLESRCFQAWKRRFAGRIADPGRPIRLDDFPKGFCFLASRWERTAGPPIVVLERLH